MTSSVALLVVASVVAMCAALTALSAAGLSPATRRRDLARRARRVRHDPSLVNLGDVRERLRRELPSGQAAYAWERVLLREIDAATAWGWLHTYGADPLVHALAIGEGQVVLKRVLRGEQEYDAQQTAVLAVLAEPRLFEPVG
jgi:hypothetical protein